MTLSATEVMNYGLEVIDELKSNLTSYLKETDKTIDDIRGCALQKVVAWDKLDEVTRYARIIENKCTKCYDCTTFCMYDAITYQKGSEPKIDPIICKGFRSCYASCPRESIVMESDLSSGTY